MIDVDDICDLVDLDADLDDSRVGPYWWILLLAAFLFD
jgi:hypothetical protein